MKRIIFLLLAMIILLSACTNTSNNNDINIRDPENSSPSPSVSYNETDISNDPITVVDDYIFENPVTEDGTTDNETDNQTNATDTTSPSVDEPISNSDSTHHPDDTAPETSSDSNPGTDIVAPKPPVSADDYTEYISLYKNNAVKHIKATYSKEDKTLQIDADVIMSKDLGTLYSYSAEQILATESIQDKLKAYFFGERTKEAYFNTKTRRWTLDGRLNEQFTLSFESHLFGYSVIEDTRNDYSGSYNLKLSNAAAVALDLYQSIGIDIEQIRLFNTKSKSYDFYGQRRNEFELYFVQYIDGHPIYTSEDDMYGLARSTMVFNDTGISGAGAYYLSLTDKQVINDYMTLEELVSYLVKNMANYRFSTYSTVKEISFEYYIAADGRIWPCWYVYIDNSEYMSNINQLDSNKHMENDLLINAVSGEIIRMGERHSLDTFPPTQFD